jgi:VanZ family protein
MRAFFQSRLYRLISWSLFGLWFVGLNLLSSLPANDLPKLDLWQHMDKAFHFGAFALGGIFLTTAWSAGSTQNFSRSFMLSFLILAAFGVLDELRQLLIAGRSGGDWGDVLANTVGALVGCFVVWMIHRRFLADFFHHGTTAAD